jgi:hypothetical protein
MTDADSIISGYGLSPHPEGGWYREFHCSGRMLEGLAGFPGPRAAVTAIWFCMRRGEFSAFHRLRSEEVWIHLSGGPVELVLLPRGSVARRRIARVEDGGPPATVVPAGVFQAARPLGDYGFVACLVAPGFDFDDFELASRGELLEAFPGEGDLIRSFTR